MEPFSAQTAAWLADPDDARARLETDDLDVLGFIDDATNATLLCRIGGADELLFAVYKPEEGMRPLWDFPAETLPRREVAAHLVSDFLGWEVVPPTVLRDGPHGPGSVQLFVPHNPAEHYFQLVEQPRWHAPLTRLAMFDLVTNNADRKGGHILRHLHDDGLYGIDNGLTFHPEPKLRTVVWDVDEPFADPWKSDLRRLCEALETRTSDLVAALRELLATVEVRMLARRAERVAGMDTIPSVPPDARPYPWPPL